MRCRLPAARLRSSRCAIFYPERVKNKTKNNDKLTTELCDFAFRGYYTPYQNFSCAGIPNGCRTKSNPPDCFRRRNCCRSADRWSLKHYGRVDYNAGHNVVIENRFIATVHVISAAYSGVNRAWFERFLNRFLNDINTYISVLRATRYGCRAVTTVLLLS